MRLQRSIAVFLELVILALVFLLGDQFASGYPPITSSSLASVENITTPITLNCPGDAYRRRSLLGATPIEVAQHALHYTCHTYRVFGSSATIRLARPVTLAELPALGFGKFYSACDEPGFALVIMQGDFDMQGIGPMGGAGPYPRQMRVPFIGYVFNLRVGLPTLTMLSQTGGRFKIALNDPSLPDDPIPVVATSLPGLAPVGVPTVPLSTTPRPCGTPVAGFELPVSPVPMDFGTRVPLGTPIPYPSPATR